MITFQIDFPPATANTQYETRAGRRFLKQKVRDYRDEVAQVVRQFWLNGRLPEPPYSLSLLFIPPDNKTRDSDNHLKVVMDALKPALWDDSWHVVPMTLVSWWPLGESDMHDSCVQITLESVTMKTLVDVYRNKYSCESASTG